MRRLFPAFVQRRWLIAAARRALQAGRAASALEILRDELLVGDPRAESLRAMALPLVPTPPPPPPGGPVLGREGQGRGELFSLLAQMRAARSAGADPASRAPAAAGPGKDSSAVGSPGPRPLRLRMSIDDVGTFLICAGPGTTVGHSRAGESDVPILADLLPRHARFVLEPPSFHAAGFWRVEPLGAARVRVDGVELTPAGCTLRSGAQIRLAEHSRLEFLASDPASSSALLDLGGSVEAAGARRVVLFAPGADGCVRLGSRSDCLVAVNLGTALVELSHDGELLRVRCESGLVPDEEQGGVPRAEVELPLRLSAARHLRLSMQSPSARPRWISFAPLEDA
jgi:hypothetical protein